MAARKKFTSALPSTLRTAAPNQLTFSGTEGYFSAGKWRLTSIFMACIAATAACRTSRTCSTLCSDLCSSKFPQLVADCRSAADLVFNVWVGKFLTILAICAAGDSNVGYNPGAGSQCEGEDWTSEVQLFDVATTHMYHRYDNPTASLACTLQ